jgi:RsiW-degrading membrane proteinase PrsW (M82 family)
VIVPDPRPAAPTPAADKPPVTKLSARDHFYWVLLLALTPLFLSILRPEPADIRKRLEKAVQDRPDLKKILEHPEDNPYFTLDDLLRALPGERLDQEAYLPRSSQLHWLFAAAAAAGFFILGCLLFAHDMGQRKDLILVGLFTGTFGVVLLLGVKSILGLGLLDELILGGSLTNFWVRLLVFTISVALFEELFKALPLLWHYRHQATLDWRGACLWGMASGAGFGISEAIIYASSLYNGIYGGEVYMLRFVSCVALHAVWSASVGITLSQYHRYIKGGLDALVHGDVEWHEVVIPLLRVLAIPMILHGLYDTLITRETYAWGLLVALLSFAWLGWQIESQREEETAALAVVPTGEQA